MNRIALFGAAILLATHAEVIFCQDHSVPIAPAFEEEIVLGEKNKVHQLCAQQDPEALDCHGFSALMVAAWHGHLEVAEVLVACGFDPSFAPELMPDPLYLAAESGAPQLVKLFLDHGADPNRWAFDAPLMVACEIGNLEIARLLLERGANPHSKVSGPAGDVRTSLMLAKKRRNRALVRLLKKYRAQ